MCALPPKHPASVRIAPAQHSHQGHRAQQSTEQARRHRQAAAARLKRRARSTGQSQHRTAPQPVDKAEPIGTSLSDSSTPAEASSSPFSLPKVAGGSRRGEQRPGPREHVSDARVERRVRVYGAGDADGAARRPLAHRLQLRVVADARAGVRVLRADRACGQAVSQVPRAGASRREKRRREEGRREGGRGAHHGEEQHDDQQPGDAGRHAQGGVLRVRARARRHSPPWKSSPDARPPALRCEPVTAAVAKRGGRPARLRQKWTSPALKVSLVA